MLADKGVDGILFCMSLDSDKKKALESVRLMEKLKVPFVMIDRFLEEADLLLCNCQSQEWRIYAATKHLLELGHRKIGCVAGPLELEDSRYRLRGYKEALEEYGVEFDPELIYEGNYDRKSGMEAMEYFLLYP